MDNRAAARALAAWFMAASLVGCGPRGSSSQRPSRPAPPPPGPPLAGPLCAACSAPALQCTVSGSGGPTKTRYARVLGTDNVGCWGLGDPGLFDRDPAQFWFRCDLRQFCVERPSECYPANLTPTGFWLNIPGKSSSLVCGAPR